MQSRRLLLLPRSLELAPGTETDLSAPALLVIGESALDIKYHRGALRFRRSRRRLFRRPQERPPSNYTSPISRLYMSKTSFGFVTCERTTQAMGLGPRNLPRAIAADLPRCWRKLPFTALPSTAP